MSKQNNPYLKMDHSTRRKRLPAFIAGMRRGIINGDRTGHYGGINRDERLQWIEWAEIALDDTTMPMEDVAIDETPLVFDDLHE